MLDTKYVTKIVVTGGPCSGKSTALAELEKTFSRQGYYVLFIGNTADSLRGNHASPELLGSAKNFERMRLELQESEERIYEMDARHTPHKKVLLICDGGALDGKADVGDAEYADLLQEEGWNEVTLRDSYDAVFHLTTAAKGQTARYKGERTPEEAVIYDDALISAWTGQPHFRVIACEEDFSDKMAHLVDEVASFLGIPEPMEVERRYLIEYPDIAWLEEHPHCEPIEILQAYLRLTPEEEVRLRRRGAAGNYVYFETAKEDISSTQRLETERRLTKEEFDALLEAADHPLILEKTRYCFTYDNQYLEIDVYPFWDDKAILEMEFCREPSEIRLPPELKVIREITEDPAWRNSALAKKYCAERGPAEQSAF